MQINVRVSGELARKMGAPRFPITLPAAARVEDLLAHLRATHPQLTAEFARVVVIVGGIHQPKTAVLENGQEVALLMPMAGG